MITAVEIENFKGIRERTRIEIKPITLLFGPNSAGKSTLLHALQLAREIFTRRNLDVDVTDGGAGFIDLGGFRNYVHGRDATKAVTLRFDLDLSSTNFLTEYPIPEYGIQIPGRPNGEGKDVSEIGDEIITGWVEIALQWCPHTQMAYISDYDVGLDGEFVARIVAQPEHFPNPTTRIFGQGLVDRLNIHHPLIRWASPSHGSFGVLDSLMPHCRHDIAVYFGEGEIISREELARLEKNAIILRVGFEELPKPWILSRSDADHKLGDPSQTYRYIFAATPEGDQVRLWGVEYPWAEWTPEEAQDNFQSDEVLSHFRSIGEVDHPDHLFREDSEVCFENVSTHALPDLDRELKMMDDPNGLDRLKSDLNPELASEREGVFTKLLSRLLLVPGRVLRNALTELRYVGPVREAVPRHFVPPRFPDPRRWAGGLAAWDALVRNPVDLAPTVSEWLSGAERLNTGYDVRIEQFRELPTDHELAALIEGGRMGDDADSDKLRAMLDGLPVRRRAVLVVHATGKTMHPADVGQGITQAVPVVVAALHPFESGEKPRGGLVAIEQPELHLHPRQQAALGDVFIASALRSTRNRFILETHSEHLILRLQRRIREATARWKNTPPNRENQKDDIPPDERAPSVDPLKLDVRDIDIGVYYVRSTDGQTLFAAMDLDLSGDFVIPWPDDFFEIDFHERFGE